MELARQVKIIDVAMGRAEILNKALNKDFAWMKYDVGFKNVGFRKGEAEAQEPEVMVEYNEPKEEKFGKAEGQ